MTPLHTYDPSGLRVVVLAPVFAAAGAINTFLLAPLGASIGDINPSPAILIEGFAPGTFLVARRNVDTFRRIPGCDGESARVKPRDSGGSIEFVLEDYSKSNTMLSLLATQDDNTATGICSILVQDPGALLTFVLGSVCWVRKRPDFSRASSSGSVRWMFDANTLQTFQSGGRAVV